VSSALREQQRARALAELRAVEGKETVFVEQFTAHYGAEHPKTQRQRAQLRHTRSKIAELEGSEPAEVGS
jgi:hypothetical protein